MADKELTARELKQNLTQARKDAADVAKSAKEIRDKFVEAASAIARLRDVRNVMGGGSPGSYRGPGGSGGGGGMPNQADMGNSLYRPGVGLSDFTNFASGMAKGFSGMMPDVGSVIQRAGNYYNATVMGGFRGSQRMSRGAVENATFGVLAEMGGITSAGSSAMVANIFANQGLTAGSSTYTQNVRAVGNAARYLNMSNETAAAAIGGLGTGASSANIMRNFGIYTSDPNTGQERSMADIFEDLASRLTRPGTNPTAEDVQDSIRRGALGAAISASGLSDDQKQLFKQYMIERANGNRMDLTDQNQMKKLMDAQNLPGPGTGLMAMNDNPLNAMMDLETSAEGVEKSATPAYILGLRGATAQLKGLDFVVGNLVKVFGALNSQLQTVLGARTTQGLLTMANSSLNLASSGIQAMLDADPTGITKATAGAVAAGVGATGLTFAGTLAGGGNIAGLMGGSGSTFTGGDGGNSAMGTDTGSISGKLGGLDTTGFTIGSSEKTEVSSPLKGTLTTKGGYKYGDVEKAGNGTAGKIHDGIDYVAAKNTAVYAVAAGEVIEVKKDYEDSRPDANGKLKYQGGSYGNYIKLDHGVGKNGKRIYTVYAHLLKGSIPGHIKKYYKVKSGEFIGQVGRSGEAYGYHLHYELFEGSNTVNPNKLRGLLRAGKASGTNFSISSEQSAALGSLVSGLQSLYSGDVQSGLSQLQAALGVSGLTSKYNVPSPSPATGVGNNGTGGTGGTGSVNNNTVNVNLNIKDASPSEAKKFADYVKEYLESETLTSNLGSY
jgi:hypothetical protein